MCQICWIIQTHRWGKQMRNLSCSFRSVHSAVPHYKEWVRPIKRKSSQNVISIYQSLSLVPPHTLRMWARWDLSLSFVENHCIPQAGGWHLLFWDGETGKGLARMTLSRWFRSPEDFWTHSYAFKHLVLVSKRTYPE